MTWKTSQELRNIKSEMDLKVKAENMETFSLTVDLGARWRAEVTGTLKQEEEAGLNSTCGLCPRSRSPRLIQHLDIVPPFMKMIVFYGLCFLTFWR